MAIQDIDLGTILENGEDGDVARTAFTKVNNNFDELDTRVAALEALDIGDVTSVNGVTAVDGNVELTPADIGAATAAQGAKADTAIQPSIFGPALDNKVDKVVGYQLSQEDFTTALKTKLEGLDDAGFQGFYVDLVSLQASVPVGQDGWWAFIDADNVTPISIAVWNATAEVWEVRPGGGGGSMTPEQVKLAYESNPDTNAFTDAEKTKLGGIEAGAQVNVATNISQGVRTGTSVSVNSSTGTGAILTGASVTEAGIMVASDKSKLDGVEAGAQVNVATNLAQGTRTATTAQITSSTGASATLTSASTSEAGLLSAEDKVILDGVQDTLDSKQDTLISGTNIKTINGESLLGSGDVEIAGGGSGAPLFSVMWWPQRSAIPSGYVAADGQALSRATYPDAWAGIQAGNVPTVAEATWQSTATERGKFTTGNGTTTFRLPDYNGKAAGSLGAVFLRGDGALSAAIAGVIQQDAFQGHLHGAGTRDIAWINANPGSITSASYSGSSGAITSTLYPYIGDGFNGTPRVASETRPLNVTGCWVIKLFGAVVNVGSADAAQLASDYANLASRVAALEGVRPVLRTAVAASGTAVDFTGIPSWAKRITVMLDRVSTSGTSFTTVRLGTAGGVEASGYSGSSQNMYTANTYQVNALTTGVDIAAAAASNSHIGSIVFTQIGGNTWVFVGNISTGAGSSNYQQGVKTLSGTLDRIRLTTVNGTDTFDAGTINIMYEE